MQGTIESNDKLSPWREKAKPRSKEIEALKKRNKEIINSRDNWKEKYKREKAESEPESMQPGPCTIMVSSGGLQFFLQIYLKVMH